MKMKIGFIGAGNMATALVGGLSATGKAPDVVVCDPVQAQRDALAARYRAVASADNEDAAHADILVLAVKPQYMAQATQGVAATVLQHQPLVISVAAGVRAAAIGSWLNGYARIVRAMPNRPALIGAGVTALHAAATLSAADRHMAQEVMQAVGTAVWVENESDLDTVTAVSGSGPAYFFLLIELLDEAARRLGLPPDTARTLAIETAHGAAALARAREYTPMQLREQVTSPAGTTAAALAVLEEADLRGIVRRAVTAASRRSAELAAQFGA